MLNAERYLEFIKDTSPIIYLQLSRAFTLLLFFMQRGTAAHRHIGTAKRAIQQLSFESQIGISDKYKI